MKSWLICVLAVFSVQALAAREVAALPLSLDPTSVGIEVGNSVEVGVLLSGLGSSALGGFSLEIIIHTGHQRCLCGERRLQVLSTMRARR